MVIRIGEDSSEDEECDDGKQSKQAGKDGGMAGLLGSIDMFLRQAKRASQVGICSC